MHRLRILAVMFGWLILRPRHDGLGDGSRHVWRFNRNELILISFTSLLLLLFALFLQFLIAFFTFKLLLFLVFFEALFSQFFDFLHLLLLLLLLFLLLPLLFLFRINDRTKAVLASLLRVFIVRWWRWLALGHREGRRWLVVRIGLSPLGCLLIT